MAPSRAADDSVAPLLGEDIRQSSHDDAREPPEAGQSNSHTVHAVRASPSDPQGTQSQMSGQHQPRHTNHERAFARYRDSEPARSSEDELDSVPLSVYRDRVAGPRRPPRDTSLHWAEEYDYDPPREQERLIDRVTNEWRNQPAYHDYADYTDDEEDEFFSGTDYQQDLDFWKKRGTAWVEETRQRVPKPIRRVLIVCSVIAVILWVVFIFFLNPWLKEHAFWNNVYSSALVASKNDGMPTYGSQLELTFENMIQVATLDKTHLPHGKRPGRLIFIGDVHGCKAELVHLLSKTAFDKHRDHVILTGDIINKGPDTPGVVDLARSLGASCVRGNHEDKVLLLRDELARHGTLHHPSKEQLAHEAKLPASEARARKTARQLSDEQAAWLAACPVILRIGDLPGMGSVIAVHAGLAPGVALTKQDPFQVMNMRSMDPETRVPSENRELEKWDKVWAEWQERAKKGDRAVVVYGHDSKRGLNVKGKWAKGLDSGCVNGEKLTALVVDAEGKQEIVQVKCSEDNRG